MFTQVLNQPRNEVRWIMYRELLQEYRFGMVVFPNVSRRHIVERGGDRGMAARKSMSNAIMEKFLPILKAKNFYILLPINITSSQFSQRPALCFKLRKMRYFSYNNIYHGTINNGSHGHGSYWFILLLRRAIFGILSSLCIQHSILKNIHSPM